MASVMRLHLQYRLWIANMNADINVLRICNDYLDWLKDNNSDSKVEKQIDHYKKEFSVLREELDDLRHELHLVKMKLGAVGKEKKVPEENIEELIKHTTCKNHYKSFRKKFSEIKKEFKKFEPEG
jgi:predicted  nucleic acid-binding Zn-ribbon protein